MDLSDRQTKQVLKKKLRCQKCGRTRTLQPETLKKHLRMNELIGTGTATTDRGARRWAARNKWTNGRQILCPECWPNE